MEPVQSATNVLFSQKGWLWMVSLQVGPQVLSCSDAETQNDNLSVNCICRAVFDVVVMLPTPPDAITLAGI
jgi:hypothetical protein